ncbi:MAG: shikimate dehydrogenase [Saprospiraceae bacterium]|nr:shikimate dehydrogenase [Saprospiraceae bacterium]
MKNFGIIGKSLVHSFSPDYFGRKFLRMGITDSQYLPYPLENIEDFEKLCQKNVFAGLNVTIPYKKKIVPYLDVLSPEAKEVGAVNTILFSDGKKIGYNTDVFGFEQSLLPVLAEIKEDRPQMLILGTGGASKAVVYVCRKLNIPFTLVSRNKNEGLSYEKIDYGIMENHSIVVNTTPFGNVSRYFKFPLIPYTYLKNSHFLIDLIYNPKKTVFLTKGMEQQCSAKNGLDMLVYQAEKSWQIWNQK